MNKLANLRGLCIAINKQASFKDTQQSSLGEVLGSITGPAVAGIGTGLLANKALGMDLPQSLIAGGAAALASPLLGTTLAALSPNRTAEEQQIHDQQYHGLLNTLIPGLAQFNQIQRIKADKDGISSSSVTVSNSIDGTLKDEYASKPVVKNKNLTNDWSDEDDDF